MHRRVFLASGTTAALGLIAGCSGDDGVQDSDGDGVIDSQDYAPNDPEVQNKADLQTTATSTPTAAKTATPTASATATATQTPTATATDKAANAIRVDESKFPEIANRFVEYSSEEVLAFVHPEDTRVENPESQDLWVLAVAYGKATPYGTGKTNISDLGTSGSHQTIELEWESTPTAEALHYWLLTAPEGTTYEELSGNNTEYLGETNPFEIRRDGTTIVEKSIPELSELGDTSGSGFERQSREGEVKISLSGRTEGQQWNVSFTIYKSAYVEARRSDHGRSRPEFVTYEMDQGFSNDIANILSEEAVANGFSDKRMQVEFVIDFVQSLPYVPDDVSTGYDDYTKFGAELLAELEGDCEDTSILLAGVLQSEPFGYDMILIQPPGHMAAGIYGDDLPGYYWEVDGRKYYYIETTATGWGIGDLPDVYKGSSAYTHQV